MTVSLQRIIAIAACCLAMCLGMPPDARGSTAAPRVLVLVSYQYGIPVPENFIRGVSGALKSRGVPAKDVYIEHLDIMRNRDPEYRRRLAALLAEKLRGQPVSLIIGQGLPVIQFLQEEGRALYPDVPLLLNLGTAGIEWRGAPRKLANYASSMDFAGTLREALALLPQTRHVLVTLGRDAELIDQRIRTQLAEFSPRVTLEYTSDLRYDDLMRRVASLPPGSIILNPTYFGDRHGHDTIPAEVSAAIAARANAPMFVMYDNLLGNGAVGGSVLKSDAIGSSVGQMAADVLLEHRQLADTPAIIPVSHVSMYDWRQLNRWGIDPSRVPPGAILINHPITIWTEYREYVIGAMVVFLVLCTLLLLLLRQNRLRRQAQQSLTALNTELETRVQARTADLQQAMDALQRTQKDLVQSEKLAALGSMVAGIAHELNTPIGNAVLAASSLAQMQTDFAGQVQSGLTRSALTQFMTNAGMIAQVVERNLARAADLVTGFKQVAIDRTTSQRRRFKLADVCAETIIAMAPVLRGKGYRIDAAVADDIVLDSYPGPLGQVLDNLLQNAIVHGFGDRGHGHIRIGARRDGERIVIEVADDGAGMEDNVLHHIFDPFFTTRLGQGGSGLGLHIAHNLVVGLLGGQISVASAPGAGSRFTITIPPCPPEPAV